MRHTYLILGTLIILTLSCIDREATTSRCLLDAMERSLVAEIVEKSVADALFVTSMTHDQKQAAALSLIGVDEAYRTIISTVDECLGPIDFEPYCEASYSAPQDEHALFWLSRDRCAQLACESDSVRRATIYMTMRPQMLREDRHVFTYETDAPVGYATYRQNPLVDWRIEESQDGTSRISAVFDLQLEIEPIGIAPINLTYSGDFESKKIDDETVEFDLALSLTHLVSEPAVEALVSLSGRNRIEGNITANGQILASISQEPNKRPVISWVSDCEPLSRR